MNMTKTVISSFVFCTTLALFADPFGAPPDAVHAWGVHDDYRPGVKKITADGVKPPSDAIVLFDGTSESIQNNWCDHKGNPTRWKLNEKGELVSVRGAGSIFTKRKFSDCQLHVEWAAPENIIGVGQGRGNSGVFLMGEYEIQVLDSYETDPSKTPNPNPNYSDGQAGAAYGQNPPAVNPCRAPGVFNTYDIIFHAPRYNSDGTIRLPANITVLFNGVLVQDNWKFDGPTGFRHRAFYRRIQANNSVTEIVPKSPLSFQDHGNPVKFRNVWIREISNPEENVTHGSYYAKPEEVLKLRAKTAAELDASFEKNWGKEKLGRKLLEAWRVASYEATPARLERVKKLEEEFISSSKGITAGEMWPKFGIGKWELRNYYYDLVVAGATEQNNPTIKAIDSIK